jgi:3-oxoacyl-[acyl-carrier protein] reductase
MFMKTKKKNIIFDFTDKNVVVVGGSRGIGLEVAKQFIDSGALVTCLSRKDPLIESLKFIQCDLSQADQIKNTFNKIEKIDILINVAGTNLCQKIDFIDEKEWNRVLDINLKSFFLTTKYSIEKMLKNGYGRIVNVSSIAGRNKSIVSGVHYTSSKAGIIGLTRQLSHELAAKNILVNCVCPSQTLTEMLEESMTKKDIKSLEKNIPIKRISSTYEQAMPILFLCSDAASYITGACIDINGGQL